MAYSKENATCVEQAAQRKKALRMPRLLSDSIYLKLDWPSRFCTSFYVIFLTLLVVLFFWEIYLFELRDINDKKTISYTALCILKKKKKKKKKNSIESEDRLNFNIILQDLCHIGKQRSSLKDCTDAHTWFTFTSPTWKMVLFFPQRASSVWNNRRKLEAY